jgi:UDP-N-acetylmuramoylalanine--D-glutamate ligase
VLLFSPGFTSFGMFLNEFDRGDKFVDYVRKRDL